MKKFVNLSLALLLMASVVPVQAMEVKNIDVKTQDADVVTVTEVARAGEEIEFDTRKKEVTHSLSAKEFALPAVVTTFAGALAYTKFFDKEKTLPVALAGLAASILYMRIVKPETQETEDQGYLQTGVNAISKRVNQAFGLSYKYKDPIHDAFSVCLLAYVGSAAFSANSNDMFNNISRNLPFGLGNFMKAK